MKKFLRACTLVLGLVILLTSCSVFSTQTVLHQDMIQDTVIKHIREKSWIWELFSNDYHMVIGDTLYVDDDQWKDFSPDSRVDRALIIHENEHAVRQAKEGVWNWVCKYIFDPSFRLQEERAAIEAEWRYRIQDGQRFTKWEWDIIARAKQDLWQEACIV